MDNVLHFRQPALDKSTFDLQFQDQKLFFDVGFQNEKVIIFWYEELDNNEQNIVYEKAVSLNSWDKFLIKTFGSDPQKVLKKKALKNIRKAIESFRKKMILQDNMTDLIMEIMDAGQTSTSKAQ